MTATPSLPRIKRIEYFRSHEDDLIAVLADSIRASRKNPQIKLSQWHDAIAVWSQMAGDVPNGGFAQFFWNHHGDYGVCELVELMVSLGEDKLADSIRDALQVYQQNITLFATTNPWDELFGRIKEFDCMDKSFELRRLKGTRALEKWIRTHIQALVADEEDRPIDPAFTGAVESKHPNGLTSAYLEIKKGKPHGAYREFFDDGSVRRVRFYKNGKASGDYWLNGQLKRKESKEGTLKVIEWYYPSGKIQKRYVQDKSGYAVEPIRLFHENGQLAEELNITHGKRSGPWLKFFEDGSPKLQAEYREDEKLIVNNAWDDSRRQVVVNGTGTYTEDLWMIDFAYSLFFKNNGPSVRELKNGITHGTVTTYWQGRVSVVAEYRNGLKDGTSTHYWENGRVRSIEQYKTGKLQEPVQDFPKFDNPIPAVILSVKADESLYAAWSHIPVDEYPQVLNLDEIQKKLVVPAFLQNVYERNLTHSLKSNYEDANTFDDGVAYFVQVNEVGVVTDVDANASGIYSGNDWGTYIGLLQQLRFSPGRIRGRAVACQVLVRVDHTFVEGKLETK